MPIDAENPDYRSEYTYYKTESGIEYIECSSIDDHFFMFEDAGITDYDESVAKSHLYNYGVIFVDPFGHIIDDEYELEEVYEHYLSNDNLGYHLERCPDCGSADVVVASDTGDHFGMYASYSVICRTCLYGPGSYNCEEDAVEAWNALPR